MNRETLDRSLVHGLAWTGATKWASQLLTWISTILVMRFLAPQAYGLVGMALVFVGLMQLVNEFGLGAAVVQRRDLTESQTARLGGVALLIGFGLCALASLTSGLIATFFHEPAVRPVVFALSMLFPVSALQVLPRALLQRELQFRRLATADGLEPIVTATVTLTVAAVTQSYWALVAGPIVGKTTTTLLLLLWRPHRLAWPRRGSGADRIGAAVTFGWQVVVARISWYAYSNADFTIVGRVLGPAALGVYTLGWTIGSIPVDRVSALLAGVTPGILSAVQHDEAALRRYLAKITEGLALVTFPASVGIALIADLFVAGMLGPAWQPAIWPLRFLALSAALRSLSTLPPQLIVATGHAKANMWLTLGASIVMPVLFYLATPWGPSGVAFVWLAAHPIVVLPWFVGYALYLTRMRLSDYVRALGPATLGTAIMTLAVLGVRALLPAGIGPMVRLGLVIASGVASYGAVVQVCFRDRVDALLATMRGGETGASAQEMKPGERLDQERSRVAPAPDLFPLLRGMPEEAP
ncbi:MAG TPA: lipopolysaccharide biosynthesis protein [Gemmatimonadales bacterium]|nr:lipopolysaccharide biosynthesis protein [Gemmatimonadales bacterium]